MSPEKQHSAKKVETEGIKYTGSKKRIIPYILQLTGELKNINSVLDGFSGTTRVSQALAQNGYNTTANDISAWSEVFGQCYLLADKPDAYYQKIIDHLNSLPGVDGWFSEHYGTTEPKAKKPFQLKNSRRLDAIREEIEHLGLEAIDKSVLLTSLILALDKVDSTIGHYAAYLTEWSPRSHNDLELKLPRRFPLTSENRVVRDDIFNTIARGEYDLAYFDPPYGSNNEKMPPSRVRYAAYYHLWTSVVQYDKPPVFGVANRREDSRDGVSASVFEEFRKDENEQFIAMKAIERLIKETNARYILLSYSSGGRASKAELHNILESAGTLLKSIEIDHKLNVMSQMRWSNKWVTEKGAHKEYLFLLEKN